MPFYLSIKPQESNIKLPWVEYDKIHEAETKATEILTNCPGLYFIAILFQDENTPSRLISNVIQKGFSRYSWTQYKLFERSNRINSFFVLNGDHYIKLNPYVYDDTHTTISIKCTKNEKDAIFATAKSKKMTVSDYIRNLIKKDK